MLGRRTVGGVANALMVKIQREWRGPEHAMREMDDMLMTLGRHGRQDVLKLEELEVVRVRDYYDALCRLFAEENKHAKGK